MNRSRKSRGCRKRPTNVALSKSCTCPTRRFVSIISRAVSQDSCRILSDSYASLRFMTELKKKISTSLSHTHTHCLGFILDPLIYFFIGDSLIDSEMSPKFLSGIVQDSERFFRRAVSCISPRRKYDFFFLYLIFCFTIIIIIFSALESRK